MKERGGHRRARIAHATSEALFMRPRPAVRTSTAGGSRPPSQRSPGNCSGRREHWAAFAHVPDGPGLSAIGNQRHNGKPRKHKRCPRVRPLASLGPPPWDTCRRGCVQQVHTRPHTTHHSGHGPLSTGQDRALVCATTPGPNQTHTQGVHVVVPSSTTQQSTITQ